MKARVVFTIIGVVLLFFGFCASCVFMTVNTVAKQTGRFDDQKPLYEIRGIVVDSSGDIYYGIDNHSSIQVYDNTGGFLYRFAFKSVKFLEFYIDKDDVLHVVMLTSNGDVYSLYDGNIIDTYKTADSGNMGISFRKLRESSYSDDRGNRYDISGTTVRMYDDNGTFIRKIVPNGAPVWPFPAFVYFGISIFGGLIVFLFNRNFFADFFTSLNPRLAKK